MLNQHHRNFLTRGLNLPGNEAVSTLLDPTFRRNLTPSSATVKQSTNHSLSHTAPHPQHHRCEHLKCRFITLVRWWNGVSERRVIAYPKATTNSGGERATRERSVSISGARVLRASQTFCQNRCSFSSFLPLCKQLEHIMLCDTPTIPPEVTHCSSTRS
jgi:hypothetical protein